MIYFLTTPPLPSAKMNSRSDDDDDDDDDNNDEFLMNLT